MKTFDYELDEFMPIPGQALYVYGTATIEYEYNPGDKEVGLRPGIKLLWVNEIEIDSHRNDGEFMRLPPGPLFGLIENALLASDHVADAAREHLDSDQFDLF